MRPVYFESNFSDECLSDFKDEMEDMLFVQVPKKLVQFVEWSIRAVVIYILEEKQSNLMNYNQHKVNNTSQIHSFLIIYSKKLKKII